MLSVTDTSVARRLTDSRAASLYSVGSSHVKRRNRRCIVTAPRSLRVRGTPLRCDRFRSSPSDDTQVIAARNVQRELSIRVIDSPQAAHRLVLKTLFSRLMARVIPF